MSAAGGIIFALVLLFLIGIVAYFAYLESLKRNLGLCSVQGIGAVAITGTPMTGGYQLQWNISKTNSGITYDVSVVDSQTMTPIVTKCRFTGNTLSLGYPPLVGGRNYTVTVTPYCGTTTSGPPSTITFLAPTSSQPPVPTPLVPTTPSSTVTQPSRPGLFGIPALFGTPSSQQVVQRPVPTQQYVQSPLVGTPSVQQQYIQPALYGNPSVQQQYVQPALFGTPSIQPLTPSCSVGNPSIQPYPIQAPSCPTQQQWAQPTAIVNPYGQNCKVVTLTTDQGQVTALYPTQGITPIQQAVPYTIGTPNPTGWDGSSYAQYGSSACAKGGSSTAYYLYKNPSAPQENFDQAFMTPGVPGANCLASY